MDLDSESGRLAVACARSNDLWILDAGNGALLKRIDTLPRPRAVLFHPSHDAVYVAEGLSSVALIRLDDQRVVRRFRPRARVTRLRLEPKSGRLFAAHENLPTLGIYALRDFRLETSLPVGGAVVDFAFHGQAAWLATRQADALVKLSLVDLGVRNAALAGPDPRALDLAPAQDRAFVACHGRRGELAALVLPTSEPSPEALSLSVTAEEAGETDLTAENVEAAEDAPEVGAGRRDDWSGGGLAVFRLSDVRRVDYIEMDGGPVAVLAGPQGRRALVACEDGQLRDVDLQRRRVRGTLALGGLPTAMLPDPDGRHVLVALADRKSLLRVRVGSGW
jgi:DNA-binding beta-propeller fold protein YncE